jgi:hypothetical protein
MAFRLMRAYLARGTVVAAAFALPLLASASAQAALGGASPEKTVNRPDLVSATILNGSAVDYCFDKTITNASFPTPANFVLGGYRAANAVGANGALLETAITSTPADSCVRANFPSTAGDLNQYTIGTVLAATVTANGGVPTIDGNNNTDSTQLTGSTTNNGTAGFTTGPDLTGVIPDSTTNTITYAEDQAIGALPAPAAADFYFVDAGGNVCTATVPPVPPTTNTITVSFNGDLCTGTPFESVSNAVRAGQFADAIGAANDQTSLHSPSTNDDNEAVVPNPPNAGDPTGTTAKPDLTDVKMETDQSAIDFTFNKTVAPSTAADFFADLSNGTEVSGNATAIIATSTTSTTIRVQFPFFTTYDEYVVGGSVFGTGPGVAGGAVVESGTTTVFNTPGALPLDAPFGNAGALARGFTTGPDVLGAVGDTTTGVVRVLVDQRAFSDDPADIDLLDNTGDLITAAPAGSVSLPTQGAGQQLITVQFLPGQIVTAANLAFENGAGTAALTTNLGTGTTGSCSGNDCFNQNSVDQVLSITTTSSVLHSAKLHKAQSKQWLARRDARLKAEHKAWLAKLIKRGSKHHRI